MTGYQRAKIVGLWLKAKKPMSLDEFAATIDLTKINDPAPTIKPIETPSENDLGVITAIFGDVKVLTIK